jgi:hypothetical protein
MLKAQKCLCVFFTIHANSKNVPKGFYRSQRLQQNNLILFRECAKSLYANKVKTPSEMDPVEIRLIRKVVINQRGVKFFKQIRPPPIL